MFVERVAEWRGIRRLAQYITIIVMPRLDRGILFRGHQKGSLGQARWWRKLV